MKGDFSRDTFDSASHFSRVLMQQGRVQLDADWNEQASIVLHYLQTLAADLIGPHGGPAGALGFEITVPDPAKKEFVIGSGRYYVDGILCANEHECAYDQQPDYPLPEDSSLDLSTIVVSAAASYAVYLDVWERHLSYLDDDHMREAALGGPDTATRAKTVWQVKIGKTPDPEDPTGREQDLTTEQFKLDARLQAYARATSKEERIRLYAELGSQRKLVARLQRRLDAANAAVAGSCDASVLRLPRNDARMQAQVKLDSPSADPCITAPDAKYRGAENQLYRVEIHKVVAGASGTATSWSFKWSRDNGSIAAAIVKSHGPELTVYPARGFAAGHWVELTNAGQELRGEPGAFAKIVKVEGDVLTVDPPASGCTKVRRWDQGATGGVKLVDGVIEGKADQWIDLEQGIQVRFEPGSVYRSGDYWLIPARAATGKIEWPLDENGQPAMLPAHGIEHHYAPLAVLSWDGTAFDANVTPCRCTIDRKTTCPGPA